MNIKTLMVAAIATTLFGFTSCSTSEKTINYKDAQRYFVRNDVKDYSPRIITNAKEFDQFFGMAAVMGSQGMPTPVNFDKENVIAIIEPETNKDTEIKIKSIKKEDNQIVVRYKVVTTGAPRSYSTVPCQVVKISKKYGNNAKFVKE